MDIAYFELITSCSKCGAALPLSRPEQSVTCGHCLAEVPVDDEVWRRGVGDLPQRLHTFSVGGSERWQFDRPGLRVQWLRGRGGPPCEACGEATSLRGDALACAACGKTRPVQQAPRWLAEQNANVHGVVADAEPPPAASGALALSCVNCGGSLSADGSSRVVPCEYCNSNNVLPDDVWRMFHPPRALRRFWLLLASLPVERHKPGAWHFPLWLLAPLGFTLAFGGTFMPIGIMALLGKIDVQGGSAVTFGAIFVSIGGVASLVFLAFLGDWFYSAAKKASILRRAVITAGRMRGGGGDETTIKLKVEVLDPATRSRVIADGFFPDGAIMRPDFERLGGEGGLVRVWVNEDRPAVNHVFLEPFA